MLSPLARRVERGIRLRDLWGDADRVAVAVSGGADSVAMLLLLAEIAPRVGWDLVGLIHVNHGLRGADADEDAAFCRRLALRFKLPIDVTSVDVAGAAASTRRSIEATARTLRYAAFEAAAVKLGATVVATGHTRDDQAETVMLRLLRGATARGVSAIRPKRGMYARPMLVCRRAELRCYLSVLDQEHREDASNVDRTVPRNRLRHELMPVVEQAWPGGVAALARFAELAADDEHWLSALAAVERAKVVRSGANGVELEKDRLMALPAPIARRVVRDALEAAGGSPTWREIDAVLRLARGAGRSGRFDLHGLRAERAGDVLRVGPPSPVREAVAFEYHLDVPGEVRIAETGESIRASFVEGPERPTSSAGREAMVVLQASSLALPLTVRTRRPGDRLTPLGAPGGKTLQDLFVDRKVPREARAAVPVVVDAEGRIVWVVGVAMAEGCRVRTPQAGMVILESSKKDVL